MIIHAIVPQQMLFFLVFLKKENGQKIRDLRTPFSACNDSTWQLKNLVCAAEFSPNTCTLSFKAGVKSGIL